MMVRAAAARSVGRPHSLLPLLQRQTMMVAVTAQMVNGAAGTHATHGSHVTVTGRRGVG